MDNFINEVLRMYGPLKQLLFRKPTETIQLGNL